MLLKFSFIDTRGYPWILKNMQVPA